MLQTPSGVEYVRIPGRYLKGTASHLKHSFMKYPPRTPFGVICPHTMHDFVKFSLAFDKVEVVDGLIIAFSERAMLGINEFGHYQIRTEPKRHEDFDFIPLNGSQDVIMFKVDSSKAHLQPHLREEVQQVIKAHVRDAA